MLSSNRSLRYFCIIIKIVGWSNRLIRLKECRTVSILLNLIDRKVFIYKDSKV